MVSCLSYRNTSLVKSGERLVGFTAPKYTLNYKYPCFMSKLHAVKSVVLVHNNMIGGGCTGNNADLAQAVVDLKVLSAFCAAVLRGGKNPFCLLSHPQASGDNT